MGVNIVFVVVSLGVQRENKIWYFNVQLIDYSKLVVQLTWLQYTATVSCVNTVRHMPNKVLTVAPVHAAKLSGKGLKQ